jgi:hypothetical protein
LTISGAASSALALRVLLRHRDAARRLAAARAGAGGVICAAAAEPIWWRTF